MKYVLTLDTETLRILENFSKIFTYYEKDDEPVIKISNLTQSVFAYYRPDPKVLGCFPNFSTQEFGPFVNAIGKYLGPDSSIEYEMKELEYMDNDRNSIKYHAVGRFMIKCGSSFATMTMDEPHVVRPYKDGLILISDSERFINDDENSIVKFSIAWDDIKKLTEARKTFRLTEIRFGYLNGKFSILAVNADNDNSDTFGIEISPELCKDDSYSTIMASSILDYLYKGEYEVSVLRAGAVVFKHKTIDLTYCFGENDKMYRTKWGRK